MKTVCKDCVFAEFVNSVQTGCKLNKLDTYHENGVQLIQIKQPFFLGALEYCGFEKLCMHKRTESWPAFKQLPPSELVDEVYRETRFCYQSIIDFGPQNTLADLDKCLTSIKSQSIPPKKLTIIKKPNNEVPTPIIAKRLNGKFEKWRIENQIDNLPDSHFVDIALSIDKYPFYIYSHVDSPYDVDFTKNLDHIVNKRLIDFGILELPSKIDVISTAVHMFYNGSTLGMTLREKIIQDNFQDKIKKWTDLV